MSNQANTIIDLQRENEYYRRKVKEQQEAIDALKAAIGNGENTINAISDDVRRAAQVLWCVIRKDGKESVMVTDEEMNSSAEPGNLLESFYDVPSRGVVFNAKKSVVVKH